MTDLIDHPIIEALDDDLNECIDEALTKLEAIEQVTGANETAIMSGIIGTALWHPIALAISAGVERESFMQTVRLLWDDEAAKPASAEGSPS